MEEKVQILMLEVAKLKNTLSNQTKQFSLEKALFQAQIQKQKLLIEKLKTKNDSLETQNQDIKEKSKTDDLEKMEELSQMRLDNELLRTQVERLKQEHVKDDVEKKLAPGLEAKYYDLEHEYKRQKKESADLRKELKEMKKTSGEVIREIEQSFQSTKDSYQSEIKRLKGMLKKSLHYQRLYFEMKSEREKSNLLNNPPGILVKQPTETNVQNVDGSNHPVDENDRNTSSDVVDSKDIGLGQSKPSENSENDGKESENDGKGSENDGKESEKDSRISLTYENVRSDFGYFFDQYPMLQIEDVATVVDFSNVKKNEPVKVKEKKPIKVNKKIRNPIFPDEQILDINTKLQKLNPHRLHQKNKHIDLHCNAMAIS